MGWASSLVRTSSTAEAFPMWCGITSLDRSDGSVFVNLNGAAKIE